MRMSCLITLALLIIVLGGCNSDKSKESPGRDSLTGNWLILYPDHKLRGATQRALYGKIQDSIVGLRGLALFTLNKDGSVGQPDSTFARAGEWSLTDSAMLHINKTGALFSEFTGQLLPFRHDTMRVREFYHTGGEKLEVVWHIKKLDDKQSAILFGTRANAWRQPAARKETDTELRQRLVAMLRYYAHYYSIVSEESIYFVQTRVPLPFRYYSNGMGLVPFHPALPFTRFFHDLDDAEKAYNMIRAGFEYQSKYPFPSAGNYVKEYSMFMERIATGLDN